MVEANWPEHLSEGDLEELDSFLRMRAREDDLLLDGVHGLLSAITIGPLLVPSEEWLPEILNEPFEDAAVGKRILELLARLHESVQLELEADAYEPILGEIDLENGSTALTAQGWCEGFSRGVDLRARAWETRLSADSQLMELLSPIMALAVEEGVFTAETNFEPLSDQEYEECLTHIPISVAAIAYYWHNEPLTSDEQRALSTIDETASTGAPRRRGGRWVH